MGMSDHPPGRHEVVISTKRVPAEGGGVPASFPLSVPPRNVTRACRVPLPHANSHGCRSAARLRPWASRLARAAVMLLRQVRTSRWAAPGQDLADREQLRIVPLGEPAPLLDHHLAGQCRGAAEAEQTDASEGKEEPEPRGRRGELGHAAGLGAGSEDSEPKRPTPRRGAQPCAKGAAALVPSWRAVGILGG